MAWMVTLSDSSDTKSHPGLPQDRMPVAHHPHWVRIGKLHGILESSGSGEDRGHLSHPTRAR